MRKNRLCVICKGLYINRVEVENGIARARKYVSWIGVDIFLIAYFFYSYRV